MKKSMLLSLRNLFLFLVLLNSFNFYSQTVSPLTFADILYGKAHTLPETQEYLTKKGYKYIGESDFLGKARQYAFGRANENNAVQFIVIQDEKRIWQIDIRMQSANNFFDLKKKVKVEGYVLDKTNDAKISAFDEKYVKGEHAIIFSTDKDEDVGVYYTITYY